MNKKMKYLLAIAVVATSSIGGWAQGVDPYLDDAYLSPKEIEQRQAKERAEAKARAEAQYKARLEQERLYESARKAELEAYKKRIRDRELDAYNGQLSPDDSLDALALQQGQLSDGRALERGRRDARTVEVYGPYSQRLARFHSDAAVVIHDPDQVYINEGSPYGDTQVYVNYYGGYNGWGNSFYPWYDDFYYGYPRYSSYYGYRYDPWWPGYSYYDPWYYDRYRYYGYYGGIYGGYDRWGYRHYGYYFGIDPWFYYYGTGYSRYNYREYPSTHRSTSLRGSSSYYRRPESRTAYGSFQSARADVEAGGTGYFGNRDRSVHGSSSTGTTYRGRARSTYSGSEGTVTRQRRESSSYDSGYSRSSSSYGGSSSSRSSSSSYGGGSSSSGSSRSSGGGGSLRGRR